MLSDQLSILLRGFMILAGLAGFLTGIVAWYRGVPMETAFFRGAVACAACAFLARLILMSLFRAHVKALEIKKHQPTQPTSQNP